MVQVPIKAAAKAARDALQALGRPVTFTLKGGASFSITGYLAFRRPQDMTAGISQLESLLVVDYQAFNSAAGRAPEKGDRVDVGGRKFAVQSVADYFLGETATLYKLQVTG